MQAPAQRLLRYALAGLAAGALVLLAGFTLPNGRFWITYDLGPFGLLQWATLLAALGLLVHHLIRSRRGGEVEPFAVLFTALVFILAWREVEVDQILFGTRAFSWARFADPEMPLGIKLGLYLPSLLFTLGVLAYAVRSRPALRKVRLRGRPFVRLLIWALALLFVSQVWDLGRSIHRHYGITLFLSRVVEEAIEWVGELAVLFSAIELRLEEAPGAP